MFYRCEECGATYDVTEDGDSRRMERIDLRDKLHRQQIENDAWRSGRLWKTLGVPTKFAVIDCKTRKPLSHDTLDAAIDALMENGEE